MLVRIGKNYLLPEKEFTYDIYGYLLISEISNSNYTSLKEKLLKDHQLYFSRYQKGDKLLKVKKNYGAKNVYGVNVNDPKKSRYLWRLSFNGTNKFEGGEGDENNIKTF